MSIFSTERIEILNKLIKLRDNKDSIREGGELFYDLKYRSIVEKNNISLTEIKEYDIYLKYKNGIEKYEYKKQAIIIRGVRFKNPQRDLAEFIQLHGLWKTFLFLIGKFKP